MNPTVNQSQPFWLQRKRVGVMFALVLVVLIAGATGSVFEALNVVEANRSVIHTLEALNKLEKIHIELRNVESAQRAYVITSEERFLDDYRQATAILGNRLQQLRALISDNPRQRRNLDHVEPLVAQRLQMAAEVIALRQQSGFDAARQEVASGKGTQLMFAVDRSIEALIQEEIQSLHERSQASNWAAVRLLTALVVSALTALGLLVLVYLLMRRDRIQRAEAAEKLRLVVESSPTGIVLVDRSGKIALVNTETERLFGYQRAELLGKPIESLVPQRYRPQHPQFLQQYMARPEARSMGAGRDLFGLRNDGSEFPVEIGLHPVPTKDGLLVLSAIVDITERKQREEERRRFTARLEQSNRELQDFAYVSSHDLQEPLRKIQAFGDRLRSQYSAALGDEGRDYVNRMQKAATRMRTLIEDLLQFSRVTTKAQPFVSVDLNNIVAEVLDDLEVCLETSGGRVSVGRLPTIDADPLQMRQLFQNLIGNALKFRRPDAPPAIDIRAEMLGSGDGVPAEPLCEITVADNGIGFDIKYARRIFDVFQRLHERDQYEGSGIGLSICRKIAERHCGSIAAQALLGEGATFIISLPVRQTTSGIISKSPPETPPENHKEEQPCPHVEEAFSC